MCVGDERGRRVERSCHLAARFQGLIKTCFLVVVLSLAPGLLGPAVTTEAALSDLDQATLIDTLAREGMGELLEHLGQRPPGDAIAQKLLQIALLRVAYANPKAERPQQIAAFDRMADGMRDLIQEHPDHHQRPVWQTDLASMLMFDYLQALHSYAGEFYEFGVPTTDQRRAFESVVAQALESLVDADLRFFHLKADLPRQADHAAKRVETGLWDKMIKEYYETKTQFLLAHAAYFTTLLNDDHAYFKNLNNPRIPRQRKDPHQERDRLRALAIERLAPLVADETDPFRIRLPSACLAGRATVGQPKSLDLAIEKLDAVIRDDGDGVNGLLSQLAKSSALSQATQSDKARRLLAGLWDHPLVKQDLLLRLLVVDRTHLFELDHALAQPKEQRRAQIAKAYEVYEKLLSDPGLGQNTQGLRNYIYARWESMVQGVADLSNLPDAVLAAACELARLRGHALVQEAQQLEEGGNEQEAAERLAQAKPYLNQTARIGSQLLDRTDLTREVRSSAMFNVAMANYLLAETDTDQLLVATDMWTALAQQMPDQPIAEQAIATAVTVLRPLYTLQPRPPGPAQAYERAAAVLFDKFPTSAPADLERVHYAYYVLAPQGRNAEAARLLAKAPRGHTLYFEAQREMLVNLRKVFIASEKVADRSAARKDVLEHAQRVIRQAKALPADTDSQQLQDARKAHGTAQLILVDMALDEQNVDQALGLLDGFDKDFADEPDLVRQALSKGIVALAGAAQFGSLVNQAKQMMALFPNDAAAVIDGVLTDLTAQIDQLRAAAHRGQVQREVDSMLQRAKGLAEAAQMLAELLLDWAVRQNYTETDLVPFKLLLARSMILAGRAQPAVDILTPLLEKMPDDTDLIFAIAEAMFALGDEPSLIKAAEYYDRLIGGIGPPFPPVWWRAWLGRLQIMDRLNQAVADIPLRVRALELTDANLGGEPYKSQFKELQLKHAH